MIDLADYRTWDATAMTELVRRGDVTAAELEEACRSTIERTAGTIAAVGDLAPTALAADAPADGAPFAGVPFLVKELLAVRGLPWTLGTRVLASMPAPASSPYVDRVLAAGLRIVGSTTSSELGLLGSTESVLRGPTVNPWRDGWSAAGSSGGAAAAVAAGIVPMAHANDGGGSIRVPASVTGLFGFAPSRGRCVPTAPTETPLTALVLDHVVSRSVRDSATMLAACQRTGSDAVHPPIGRVTGPAAARRRIGLTTTTLLGARPASEVHRAVHDAAALLEGLGHEVEELPPLGVDGAALSEAFFTAAALTVRGFADMMAPLVGHPLGADDLEPFTLELAEWAATLDPARAMGLPAVLARLAAPYLSVFERVDVVLSPTLARPPWELGLLAPHLGRELLIERTGEIVGYTPIHNVAGCPAMSVPLAEVDGLPVGIHLAMAPGRDAELLGLAFELEAARPWWHHVPPRWFDREP